MNYALLKMPSETEIYDIVFGMNADVAAGPDGFGGHFYQACWHIIKEDLLNVVTYFFNGHDLPKSWTNTLIVALPKVDNPNTFSDIRPISLCNFFAKIIYKIITIRLGPILPYIISLEQSGFTNNKAIADNILLAHDRVASEIES